MPYNATLARTFEHRRNLLEFLIEHFEPGVETIWSSEQTVQLTGGGLSATQDAARTLESLGILGRRMDYQRGGAKPGRRYHWSLRVDPETARQLLEDAINAEIAAPKAIQYTTSRQLGPETRKKISQARIKAETGRGMNGHEKTAIAPEDSPEDIRAIAGPEPTSPLAALAPLRRDEPAALVEAARQYQRRRSTVNSKLEELAAVAREMGITIDMNVVADAISFATDDRLEQIMLVLPVIDRLEADIVRLNRALAEYKGKTHELDELRAEQRRNKQQIERLIAEKASAVRPT